MGQVRHGSAATTHAVRAAIQRSQASLAQLSKELEAAKRELRKDGAGAAFEALESATSPGPGADRGLLARAAAGRLIDQLQRKMEQARRWGDWTGGG